MRFCPYAQRTRMVLAHKAIPHEIVNVNLLKKPEWFLERNPLGKVPVLEFNDKVLYESGVCNDYLDEIYPQSKLNSTDPYQQARDKILMEHFSPVITAYYHILRKQGNEHEVLDKAHKQLDKLEHEITNKKFFGGDGVSMVDFHIWPYFERMPMFTEISKLEMLPFERYPQLNRWVKNMHQEPAVKHTVHDFASHMKFAEGYFSGDIDFDFGLEATQTKISQKAFAAGSSWPTLEKDVLRLYSMRFCPYAQRTRLVLAHKEIPYETVNINLREKPDWFLARNPLGKVPTLEFNDQVLYESAICDDYLDELYPHNKLNSTDPYQRCRDKILMEHCGAVISTYYQLGRTKDQESLEKLQRELDRFEHELEGKTFFGGDRLNMVDIHIWPWFERMPFMAEKTEMDPLNGQRFPNLNRWVKDMQSTPAVQAAAHDLDTYRRYAATSAAGKSDYDLGLE